MTPNGHALRSSRNHCRYPPARRLCRTRCGTTIRWAHIEARRMGAVLAHVARHQPPEGLGVHRLQGDGERLALLDERDVAPPVRTETLRVVVRHSAEAEAVLGHSVPFLACDFARLAPDADARISEEADAREVLAVPGCRRGISAGLPSLCALNNMSWLPSSVVGDVRRRRSPRRRRVARLREGRRPAARRT